LILIENGTIYTPEPAGKRSLLIASEKIQKVGDLDGKLLAQSGVECETVDASGCVVVPGLIDPHAHLIGAGGEKGYTSRMPELQFQEIICAGITTIVGLLGTDTATRSLESMQAKTSQLQDEGISAYFYTGGFQIPPQTLTKGVIDDLVLIDKIIGTGEIGIADYRWDDPPLEQIIHITVQTMLGGTMSGKAGVTHFHIGEGKLRLKLLREMLDHFELLKEYERLAACVYATHITRSTELMDEAIDLAKRGAYVDTDTIEGEIDKHIRYYLDHGGPPDHLTISSDSQTPGGSPDKFRQAFVESVQNKSFSIEQILPFFTNNTARVLKLKNKGSLKAQFDADVLVMKEGSLEIVHLFARGQQLIKDGESVKQSQEEDQNSDSKKTGR
jgi:beta-aspartyl-dipeptidase (metallo-type)